jgi:hypothetical protein
VQRFERFSNRFCVLRPEIVTIVHDKVVGHQVVRDETAEYKNLMARPSDCPHRLLVRGRGYAACFLS